MIRASTVEVWREDVSGQLERAEFALEAGRVEYALQVSLWVLHKAPQTERAWQLFLRSLIKRQPVNSYFWRCWRTLPLLPGYLRPSRQLETRIHMLTLWPRAQYLLKDLVGVLRKGGQEDAILCVFNYWIQIEPGNIHATAQLVEGSLERGDYQKAYDLSRASLKRAPGNTRLESLKQKASLALAMQAGLQPETARES